MKKFLRRLIRFLVWLLIDMQVTGRENLLEQGAMVVASNHIGIIDIVMFHYVSDRDDIFIPVAEKWQTHGAIRWLGKHLNFVFVDRFNPDLKALREMIGLMQQGNCLVIAPEGTRSRTGALIEGKPGVAYLAARSGFPVVPVAITGTEDKVFLGNLKRLRRTPVTLTAGRLFTLAPLPAGEREATLKQYTDEVMCRIAAILPERYRGIYAQHPRLNALLAK